MIEALVISVITGAVTVLLGPPLIHVLLAKKLGKAISEDLPSTHESKSGTPTMGGLIFILPFVVITLLTNTFDITQGFQRGPDTLWLPLAMVLVFALIGFWDDLGTIVGGAYTGLSWRLKFVFMAIAGVAVAWVLYDVHDITEVFVPGFGRRDLGALSLVAAFAVFFSTTTAVAITDGLDGLLAGISMIVLGAFAVIAFHQDDQAIGLLCLTMVGALGGYSWFNGYPATVIMGDVGALALGALISIVALLLGQWLLLILIGFVFVINAVSDVIQVVYFKFSNGSRIFRKTPFHHHLEMLGWPEPKVVSRLHLLSFGAAAIAIAIALSE